MSESAFINQINALIQQDQLQEAKALVSAEVKHNPRNADAWYCVALLSNTVKAKQQALTRALAVDPDHGPALILQHELTDAEPPPAKPITSPPTKERTPGYLYALAGVLLFLVGIVGGMAIISVIAQGEILGVVFNPTPTATQTPTATATSTNTPTATLTPTATASATPTATQTPVPTSTPRVPPTWTPIPTITLTPTRQTAALSQDYIPLDFLVLDADYSDALDRIILISANPSVLHILDPATMTSEQIELPRVPERISVSAEGRSAVVSHDSMITHVDLEQRRIINSWPIPYQPPDIVVMGNMVFFASSEDFNQLVSLNLDTGAVSEPGSMFRFIPNLARHPNGQYFYGITYGVSPADIHRGEFTDGTFVTLDSPYHGGHRICGLFEINPVGTIGVNSCGTMFVVGREQGDMQYAGTLSEQEQLEAMKFIDDSRLIATTLIYTDRYSSYNASATVNVNVYDINRLEIIATHYMGDLSSEPLLSAPVPQFTFINSAGTEFYLLSIQTDSTYRGVSNYQSSSQVGVSYSLLRGEISELLEQ